MPVATRKRKAFASSNLGPNTRRAVLCLCLTGCATGLGDPRFAPLGSPGEEERLKAALPPEADQWDVPNFLSEGFLLPNGLSVRVEVGSTNGMVGSVLTIGTGSGGDPVGKEGLAHLVEHLVFYQPGSHPRVSQTDELVRLGARYNAETSADATTFYEFAPAAALASLSSITSRRLADPLSMVDNTAFLHEKAIVTSELFQRGESGVYGSIVAWMQAALFPLTPYARPVGGGASALSRIALGDARDFARVHYSPKNATLLLIGPPPLADFAARVRRLLDPTNAARPVGNVVAASPKEPNDAWWAMGPVPKEVTPPDSLEAAVTLPALWVVYKLPSLYGKDGALCRVMTGGAAAARVRAHLLSDADVENVQLHVLPLANATIAAWEVTLADGQRRKKLADVTRRMIWSAWADKGPPAAISDPQWRSGDVALYRRSAQSVALWQAEPFVDRTLVRAQYLQMLGSPTRYDHHLAEVARLSDTDIGSAAFDWLAPERARTLFVDPRGHTTAVQSARSPAMDVRPSLLPAINETAALFPPPPQPSAPPSLLNLRQTILPNGLTVVVVPHNEFPIVTTWLGFGGAAAASPAGLMTLVRAVDLRSFDEKSKSAIVAEAVDSPGSTADVVQSTPANLGRALYLLARRLQVLNQTNWDVVLSRLRAGTNVEPATDPHQAARVSLLQRLYGEHPYVRYTPRQDAVKLKPSVVTQSVHGLYRPSNGFLIMVGAVDSEVAVAQAQAWFGSWQNAANVGGFDVPTPAVKTATFTHLVVHRPLANQVEINAACPFPSPSSAADVMTYRAAAQSISARLFASLRQDAGLTYGFSSDVVIAPRSATLLLSGLVDAARFADALALVRDQLTTPRRPALDAAALSQTRWALAKSVAMGYQTTQEIAHKVFSSLVMGFGNQGVQLEAQLAVNVSGESVGQALAACLPRIVYAFVGDEKRINASLATGLN